MCCCVVLVCVLTLLLLLHCIVECARCAYLYACSVWSLCLLSLIYVYGLRC